MSENSRLLTIPEFATALRVKPSCVRRWLAESKVTRVHVGRLVRIPASEIERIVQLGTRLAGSAERGGRDA
jgi:excisionase family DNA binding protein